MLRFAVVAALLLANAGAAHAQAVGEKLPPETPLGLALDGSPLTLAQSAGRPALIVFWATWCKACMKELPRIEALHRSWGERAFVVGVSTDARRRDVERFLRRNKGKLTLPLAHDAEEQVARVFGVRGVPMTVLVDRDGTIRWIHTGFDGAWLDELDAALKTLAPRPDSPAA